MRVPANLSPFWQESRHSSELLGEASQTGLEEVLKSSSALSEWGAGFPLCILRSTYKGGIWEAGGQVKVLEIRSSWRHQAGHI